MLLNMRTALGYTYNVSALKSKVWNWFSILNSSPVQHERKTIFKMMFDMKVINMVLFDMLIRRR